MISNKSESDKENAEKEDDSSSKTRVDEKAYFIQLQQSGFEQKREEIDLKLKETTQKLKELQELEKRLEKTESKLVEILGIFTAIVVTFVGTFAFSSSVLQNMDKVDIHRLIFVILCIAVFIASILRWLFDFLLRICGKETKYFKWWWVGIVICFFFVSRVDWMDSKCDTLDKNVLSNIKIFFFFSEDSCKSQDTQRQKTHTNNNKK